MLRQISGRRLSLLRLAAFRLAAVVACVPLLFAGCTSPRQWIDNGFEVGPEYCRPEAPVAQDWLDSDDQRLRSESDDHAAWWTVFNDPVLEGLIDEAYSQNLPLRVAGFRILEARRPPRHRRRQYPSPATTGVRRLLAQRQQSTVVRVADSEPAIQSLGWRIQSGVGTRLLGPLSPRRRIG